MATPCPEWTTSDFCLPIAASSVGVNVWNAMSIEPCWSASFIVDDFEKQFMRRPPFFGFGPQEFLLTVKTACWLGVNLVSAYGPVPVMCAVSVFARVVSA